MDSSYLTALLFSACFGVLTIFLCLLSKKGKKAVNIMVVSKGNIFRYLVFKKSIKFNNGGVNFRKTSGDYMWIGSYDTVLVGEKEFLSRGKD